MTHYNDPDIVTRGTVEGWIGRDGRFYGEDENWARTMNSTHDTCKTCGVEKERSDYCRPCHRDRKNAEYAALERQRWDGVCMLTEFDGDHYWSSLEDVLDYCVCEGFPPSDLQLELTAPRYARTIDPTEYYGDDLPEDCEVPPGVEAAFNALNDALERDKEVLGWFPAGIALADEQVADLEIEWDVEMTKENSIFSNRR